MDDKTEQTLDIALTPVQSSQIAAIGYHEGTGTLRVKFNGSGSEYDYTGVSAETHKALGKAESIGKFFGAHVKGKFDFKKLPPKKA